MRAKVIDERSPFYGMICDVGHMTAEGLHRISEKGAAWHSGYAYADQLQFLTNEHLSENGKILAGVLQDALVQDILLSKPLIEILCKHLSISEDELRLIADIT